MNALEQLLEFISRLQDSNIHFTLHCVRDAIMVAIVSPRTYYEVEFFSDGHIEVQAWGPADPVQRVGLDEITQIIKDALLGPVPQE